MAGGSTTRRGGRQKGTPNKATVMKQRAKELGIKALEALQSGDAASIADIRAAVEADEHSNAVDASEGTLTEAQAMQQIAMRENVHYPTALSYLQATYRDNRLPRMIRQDAAKAAIRYETPALSNVAVKQEPNEAELLQAADNRAQLASVVESVLRRAGIPVTARVTTVIDADEATDNNDNE